MKRLPGIVSGAIMSMLVLSPVLGARNLSPVQTTAAVCSPADSTETVCRFSVLDRRCEVHAAGQLNCEPEDPRPARVRLPLDDDELIEQVLYASFRGDLLLVLERHDPEAGAGTVLLLDGRSLAIRWLVKLPAFNLSIGTIENTILYQAGLGLVAAIDLERGRVVWQHSGLYEARSQAFNSFLAPEVRPSEVLFTEQRSPHPGTAPRTIRVERASGRIVSR